MQLLRVATLTGYEELAHSLGLDGPAMLERAGLHRDVLQDPENRIPAEAVARLLRASAREADCENFGLLLAERRPFGRLGPVAMLIVFLAFVALAGSVLLLIGGVVLSFRLRPGVER